MQLTIDDFQKVSNRVPLLADFKPSGKYVKEDLHDVGGIPAVMKMLLEEGLLDGDCMTVTGKTIEENLQDLPGLNSGQQIVKPLSHSDQEDRAYSNSARQSGSGWSRAKITGKEGLRFEGPAKVYDSEEDMLHALERRKLRRAT